MSSHQKLKPEDGIVFKTSICLLESVLHHEMIMLQTRLIIKLPQRDG